MSYLRQISCLDNMDWSILSIKDADATDHKLKIAQPVSLITNMKQLLGDLHIVLIRL